MRNQNQRNSNGSKDGRGAGQGKANNRSFLGRLFGKK